MKTDLVQSLFDEDLLVRLWCDAHLVPVRERCREDSRLLTTR